MNNSGIKFTPPALEIQYRELQQRTKGTHRVHPVEKNQGGGGDLGWYAEWRKKGKLIE